MTTRVYRYGLAAPHENADLVEQQMSLAHEYRKQLVEIERARRAEARLVATATNGELRAAEDAVRAADAECERLAVAIRAERKRTRKRSETQEAREILAAAREVKREAQRALYTLRETQRSQCVDCRKEKREENPCPHASLEARALRLELDAIDQRAKEKIATARGASGVFWGTYLIVESAMQASRSAPLYEKDGVTPHDPPFPRWDGSGAVAVQLQGGLPVVQAVEGADQRLRVVPSPWPEEWLAMNPPGDGEGAVRGREPRGYLPGPKGSPLVRAPATRPDGTPAYWVRKGAAREGELRMRIGSEGRDPVWAAWRLDYHRPLPKDATITWATVHRRVRGPHSEWSLCVTFNEPSICVDPADERPIVAVDVGWRVVGEELRIAVWRNSAGECGELRLTRQDLSALRQSEGIRAARDGAFDRCHAAAVRWASTSTNVPEWMGEWLRRTESAGRMVSLLRRWAVERPERADDEELAYRAIEVWAFADRHRWAEETARRTWGLRRRRDKYRVFAADLAKRHRVIVLERFDLRQVAVRAETGEDKAENETARGNRQAASVSELRTVILNAAVRRASVVASVESADSTRTHAACGVVADRDAGASTMLLCDACQESFDQDDNAARVLLTRYCEHPGDAEIIGGARTPEMEAESEGKKNSRWTKAKRLGDAKRVRLATAREAGGNVVK